MQKKCGLWILSKVEFDFMKILRIITLTLCPSETSSRNYSGKISGKKILKSASVASTFLILCPVPCSSPSPLLNFFFSPQRLVFSRHVLVRVPRWSLGLSPFRPPSPIIPQDPHGFQHRLVYLLPSSSCCFFFFFPPPLPVSPLVSRQKEERTGSIAASRGRRGCWTSSICIYIASSWAEKEGGEDEELGRGGGRSRFRNVFCEASHIDTSYSRVSWDKIGETKTPLAGCVSSFP